MMNSFERRMGRQTRREGKFYNNSDARLDKSRGFRLAGAIFGERTPYRAGMSMGFDFLHEDSFGPDNHYDSRESISSSNGPGDYSYGGIE